MPPRPAAILFLLCSTLVCSHDSDNIAWLREYGWNPVPRSDACVHVHRRLRVCVLTPSLLRLEYSPSSTFHDSASFAVVNRNFNVSADFNLQHTAGVRTVITTSTARLEFVHPRARALSDADAVRDLGSVIVTDEVETASLPQRGADARELEPSGDDLLEGLSPAHLSIRLLATGVVWRPGDSCTSTGDCLHGVIRTLDHYSNPADLGCSHGFASRSGRHAGAASFINDTHCVEGVLSKGGVAVMDDSSGPRWMRNGQYAAWPWLTPHPHLPPAATAENAARVCASVGWDRYECMWGNNVDEAACVARGCCFDPVAAAAANGQPTAMHYVAWCFWPHEGDAAPGYEDMYVYTHGRDYMGALGDHMRISGRAPLMPRYALGPFYSRWFDYADSEERDIVSDFTRNDVPLDVLVVDMGWHHTFDRTLPPTHAPIHIEPWTGFSVRTLMLPSLATMIDHMHARGVAVALNQHPHYGVQFFDDAYAAFAAHLGVDPSTHVPLSGNYTDFKWANGFFNIVMRPLDEAGVDFHWPDWQAGEWTPLLGISPTAWLSYVWYSNPYRYGGSLPVEQRIKPAHAWDRPLVLNRWGGYGSHRYPVGFSGDAATNWGILRWQAYVTPTAANAAWAWSHDIGGFSGTPSNALMIRWVQFGAFSPVLRPHTAGRHGSFRDIWRFAFPAFTVMRHYFRLRARLLPYLVNAQRHMYDTGVQTVHPLYYHWPELAAAYEDTALHCHMFGQHVLVCAITHPPDAGEEANMTTTSLWMPPGTWIEWFSWTELPITSSNGHTLQRTYALEDTPVFSRSGSIIPLLTHVHGTGITARVIDDVTFQVMPMYDVSRGAAACGVPSSATRSISMYDDDGATIAYTRGEHVHYNVTCTWRASSGGSGIVCVIGASVGTYTGAPAARAYTLRFIGTLPPASVRVNGVYALHTQSSAPDARGDAAAWRADVPLAWAFEAETASTYVRVQSPASVHAEVEVVLHYAGAAFGAPSECGSSRTVSVLGRGHARIIARAKEAKYVMNRVAWAAYGEDVPTLMRIIGTQARVERIMRAATVEGGSSAWARVAVSGNGDGVTGHAGSAVSVDAAAVLAVYESMHDDLQKAIMEVEGLRVHNVEEGVVEPMLTLLRSALPATPQQ